MQLNNTLDGPGLGVYVVVEPVRKCEKFDFGSVLPKMMHLYGRMCGNMWKMSNVFGVFPFMFTVIVQQFAVKAAVMFLLHVEI